LRPDFPAKPAARQTQSTGVLGVYDLFFNSVARRKQSMRGALALVLALAAVCTTARAEDPITFVFPAANFQPVAADAYPESPPPEPPLIPPQTPPTPPQSRSSSPTVVTAPTEASAPTRLAPSAVETSESYLTAPEYNELDCPSCNGCGGLPPGRLPNGQYPDDWMWGCGAWPYANGPGTCDDWKVGPIWDVTVDGMVMTREHTDLAALEDRMAELHATPPPALTDAPELTEQFDRGPGGRVYLTGLLPKNVGYQVMAGYEGIEEWNASLLYPEQVDEFPPFDDPTTQRSLNYRSSLHSGELNIMRMCHPALRPYCGVRYIKFDDEIWDQSVQTMTPFPPVLPATTLSTLDAYDVENNLIGFQGGVKYDIWNWGRRFSLQGFLNSGVYYNKAKYSNLQQEFETQWVDNAGVVNVTSDSESQLTIVENSNIAYVGEASLTAVCRLNRCWACRAGYQVLFIDGLNLASDVYLQSGVEDRSLLFHGWHAGLECRR
jgi:hypothetical protein